MPDLRFRCLIMVGISIVTIFVFAGDDVKAKFETLAQKAAQSGIQLSCVQTISPNRHTVAAETSRGLWTANIVGVMRT